MSIARGWNRGLRDGLEGSGLFAGFIVPVTITCILVVGLISLAIWGYSCTQKPGTCTDYSYKLGFLYASEAKCTKWPAMEMKIQQNYVKADLVYCRCTAESFPRTK